jgi:hypothetical protein
MIYIYNILILHTCAGRHLRANSTPPGHAGWNSKPNKGGGKEKRKTKLEDAYIYIMNLKEGGRRDVGKGGGHGGHIFVYTLEWKTGRQTQDTQVGTCVPTLRLPNLSVGNRKPYKGGERHKTIQHLYQIHGEPTEKKYPHI